MGRYKILAVDDDPKILKLISMILTPEGYEVIPAPSGAEALSAVQAQAPDMIIVDLVLPDMNGAEIIQAVREKFDCHAPAVFLTGMVTKDEELSRGIDIKVKDRNYSVLAKPLDKEKLLALVKNALEG